MTQVTYLVHHGVKGMKWGVRRFQKDDGSLTSAGKKRYGDSSNGDKKQQRARDKEIYNYVTKERFRANQDFYAQKQHGGMGKRSGANRRYALDRSVKDASNKYGKDAAEAYQRERKRQARNAMIGMAAVAGVALAAYGAKQYVDYKNSSAGKASRALGEAQAKQVFDKRAAEVAMLRGMRSPAPAPRTYSQADVNRVMGKKATYSGNIKASPKLKADQGTRNLKANGIDARRLERRSKERRNARSWKPRSSTNYINPYGNMSPSEARKYQDWMERH